MRRRKTNWLKEDIARLKLPAALAIVAGSAGTLKFADRQWTQAAVLAFILGCWLLAEGARVETDSFAARASLPRVKARPALALLLLIYAGTMWSLCLPLIETPVILIVLCAAPLALLFLSTARPWLPSLRLPLPRWIGAGRLELVKNAVRPGGIVAGTLELPELYRELAATIELCDGTKRGGDYVFKSWPGTVSAPEEKDGVWIARVEAVLPEDARESRDYDDERDVDGRFWELQVAGVDAGGKAVTITARFTVPRRT
jgi:hypothetical protein